MNKNRKRYDISAGEWTVHLLTNISNLSYTNQQMLSDIYDYWRDEGRGLGYETWGPPNMTISRIPELSNIYLLQINGPAWDVMEDMI